MLVRDVLKATAQAADYTVPALLTVQTVGAQRLRHVGLMISSRLTGQSWSAIGRVWGGRDRASCRSASLKAEVRLAARDAETLADLAAILAILDVADLPPMRPTDSGYRTHRRLLLTHIATTENRLETLRAQLRAIDGAPA